MPSAFLWYHSIVYCLTEEYIDNLYKQNGYRKHEYGLEKLLVPEDDADAFNRSLIGRNRIFDFYFNCQKFQYENTLTSLELRKLLLMHYFNEWDPEGLIECGAPPAEYSGEIEDICDLMDKTTTTKELAETISSEVIKIWSADYLKHGTDIMRIARKVDSYMNNLKPDIFSGWLAYKDGKTINTQGNENGIIVKDEEHDKDAHITLEQGCGNIPYAITCGVYGLMCHTTYASNYEEAEKKYENMKNDLHAALGKYTDNQDALIDWIDGFTTKY